MVLVEYLVGLSSPSSSTSLPSSTSPSSSSQHPPTHSPPYRSYSVDTSTLPARFVQALPPRPRLEDLWALYEDMRDLTEDLVDDLGEVVMRGRAGSDWMGRRGSGIERRGSQGSEGVSVHMSDVGQGSSMPGMEIHSTRPDLRGDMTERGGSLAFCFPDSDSRRDPGMESSFESTLIEGDGQGNTSSSPSSNVNEDLEIGSGRNLVQRSVTDSVQGLISNPTSPGTKTKLLPNAQSTANMNNWTSYPPTYLTPLHPNLLSPHDARPQSRPQPRNRSCSKRRRLSLPYIRRRLLPVLHTLWAVAILVTMCGIVGEVGWRIKVKRSRAGSGMGMGMGRRGMAQGEEGGMRWHVPVWLDTGWIEEMAGREEHGSGAVGGASSMGMRKRIRGASEAEEGSSTAMGGASRNRLSQGVTPSAAVASSRPWKQRQRRRVLFLTDYRDYLERMNTNTYEIVDAALRMDPSSPSYRSHTAYPNSFGLLQEEPDLELDVDVWGPQWAGWDPEASVGENVRRRSWRGEERRASERRVKVIQEEEASKGWKIQREQEGIWTEGWQGWWTLNGTTRAGVVRENEVPDLHVRDLAGEEVIPSGCPSEGFDFAWTFSDIFKQGDPMLDVLPCGTLLVQQLGDCHSLNCLKEWYPNVSNITLSKYGFELLDVFSPEVLEARFPGTEMQLFGYSADSANEWDFWPVQEAEWRSEGDQEEVEKVGKKVDAMMFGYTMPFYPIRSTVHEAVESPRPSLIQRYEHPGYYVWEHADAYDHPAETYVEGHVGYEQHRRMRRDFAGAMRETRVCVFDSSVERKMIRKYAQAMLSGCVVAADIPTEHAHDLEGLTIPLDFSWDIEQIESVIRGYLDRPEVLEEMAGKALRFARRKLTNTRKIVDVVRSVEAYRAGKRGYDLPYGVSLLCRSYWYEQDSWRPPWCEAGSASHRGGERRRIAG